jgi:hypothetical protein
MPADASTAASNERHGIVYAVLGPLDDITASPGDMRSHDGDTVPLGELGWRR